jgi:hypothetical protein
VNAEYRRWWACSRKVRYETRRIAKDKARERAAESGTRLYVYRCRYCNGWHLTKQPQGNKSRTT